MLAVKFKRKKKERMLCKSKKLKRRLRTARAYDLLKKFRTMSGKKVK